MSTSMVSTVLEIEREAEAIISAAKKDAEKLDADACEQRDGIGREIMEKARKEVAELEAKAAEERQIKSAELTASGEAALCAVKNVSSAAFDSGVQHVLKALTEK